MKLLFDEDTGPSVPKALSALGVQGHTWVTKVYNRRGVPDEEWIPWAAKNNRLVISRNIRILNNEVQRGLLADHGGMIAFIHGEGGTPLELFHAVLRNWTHLRWLYEHEPRPFAWVLPLRRGPKYRDSRVPLNYTIARRRELAFTTSNLLAALIDRDHYARFSHLLAEQESLKAFSLQFDSTPEEHPSD